MSGTTLGIIAGGGDFPLRLADAARLAGRPVFIVAIKEFVDPAMLAGYPHEIIRVGAGGRIVAALKNAGVKQIVLSGSARRMSILSMLPDAWMAGAIARIGKSVLMGGDDTLLRGATRVLEEEGFEIVPPLSIRRDLMPLPGLLAGPGPDADQKADIARGIEVLRALAPADVGQAAVIQQGLVLGIEAVEGTDALLARAAELRREGPGGVLVKISKPQQDERLDMPTVGPQTVRGAIAAGLAGIAIEAGRTVLADREETLRLADEAGLFVISLAVDEFMQEMAG
ncbi:LpxI family protein [Rhodovarius crocodyli]|uniref:LpxI family protein n=1 Tax=Rhodovarius crocodyli TaxID=1979269 RepID=A0A437MJM8_9PROT|nr:UDP-2,3-diacylglucosamine diphosphatase LpxI [Rhodovarius crocodyli]RVT97833.1 LpxI family protein [Rhodovarius crocodyli]